MNGSQRRQRRGTVYLVVLATLSIVLTISMSSLLTARTELGAAMRSDEEIMARQIARAGIETAVNLMTDNPDWRTTVSGDVLLNKIGITGGSVRVLVHDPSDGDLFNRVCDPVEITAIATYKGAVQKYRYRLNVADEHEHSKQTIFQHHPISYWPLRGLDGTTAEDLRGSADAALEGKVEYNEQDATGCWSMPQLRAVNQNYFLVSHSSFMELDYGSLSIWMQPASSHIGSSEFQTVVAKYTHIQENSTRFAVVNSLGVCWLLVDHNSTMRYIQIGSLTGDQWHHLTITWGGDGWRVYLDGLPTGHLTWTGGLGRAWTSEANDRDLCFGASRDLRRRLGGSSGVAYYFDGKLADAALFAYTLADDQVADLASRPPVPRALVLEPTAITRLVD
ncbi:MAG: LamG-like jellyroll fold domain-containing protein [Phycisphaerales bacterium]